MIALLSALLIQIPRTVANLYLPNHHSMRKANILWIKSPLTPCEPEYVQTKLAHNSLLLIFQFSDSDIRFGEFVLGAVIFGLSW